MSANAPPSPLHLHTLASLLQELVAGRPVQVDDHGRLFELSEPGTRSILAWYGRSQHKWAGNSTKTDAEEVAAQVDLPPPAPPPAAVHQSGIAKQWYRLKSISAHRFAGLTKYGRPSAPPDDFRLDLPQRFTLVEGCNGAGKTSLLNAVTWCLTGRIYRSQRPPEAGTTSMALRVNPTGCLQATEEPGYELPAVAPLPTSEVLGQLGGAQLLVDTWVELILEDAAGNPMPPLRRSLKRGPRGRIEVSEPDLSTLGLDPVAFHVGTVMPGELAYILPGRDSSLALAVATITGLRPFRDLAGHASKTLEKLKKDLPQDRMKEIADRDERYNSEATDLREVFRAHSIFGTEFLVPSPSSSTAREELISLKEACASLQERLLGGARDLLGTDFDASNPSIAQTLSRDIGAALGLLESSNLARLPSAKRLGDLGRIAAEELVDADQILRKLLKEASELTERQRRPSLEARRRLYARVAGWLRDHPESINFEVCPVCSSLLDDKVDSVTGRKIRDQLQEALDRGTQDHGLLPAAWAASALASLRTELPEALRGECDRDLPSSPGALIRKVLTEEIFEAQAFLGLLGPLKTWVVTNSAGLATLPAFEEPEAISLPRILGASGEELGVAMQRVQRAISFSRWRQLHTEACRAAFFETIGDPSAAQGENQARAAGHPVSLSSALRALQATVQSTEPTQRALARLRKLESILDERRLLESRLQQYSRAVNAIGPLTGLGDLVEAQLSSLVGALSEEAARWKDQIYQPAVTTAPRFVRADVEGKGKLSVEVEVSGVRTGAEHLSNASDLRATLLAFLIAFWRHLLETRGGLSLFLLDDPQELFDPANRENLASALPALLEPTGQILVTTNDPAFRKKVAQAIRRVPFDAAFLSLHPLGAARATLGLGPLVEEIERAREAFEDQPNENLASPGVAYLRALRTYLEDRLRDLLDSPAVRLSDKPSLSDLLGVLRSLRSRGVEPFSERSFRPIADEQALKQDHRCIELLNRSIHEPSTITYMAVKAIEQDLRRVLEAVETATQGFELWRRREILPITARPASPPPPPLAFPRVAVPLYTKVAAFATGGVAGQIQETGERLDPAWFESKALYLLNTHNFGFAAPHGCRVIVNLGDEAPTDNRLVVAHYRGKWLARRLHRDEARPSVIVLGSDAENPLSRPPSKFLEAADVQLYKVVGLLFDSRPTFRRESDEAIPLDDAGLLSRTEVALQVDGDSALPLALPGQVILCGRAIAPADLGSSHGQIVAVAGEDFAYFKRVGASISGSPHIRLFETIGGRGDSLLLRTEEVEGDNAKVPLITAAREILGVLYDV